MELLSDYLSDHTVILDDAPEDAPDWLMPSPEEQAAQELTIRQARDYNYGIIFERVLTIIEETGRPLNNVVNEIMAREPQVELNSFRSWINKNTKRKERYLNARELGAEVIEEELIRIADAADNTLEDVQRSKLRIDTRKWLLETWNRKRYGSKADNTNSSGGAVNIFIEGVVSPYTGGVTIEHEKT